MVDEYIERLTTRSINFYRENFNLDDQQLNLAYISFLQEFLSDLDKARDMIDPEEKKRFKDLHKAAKDGLKYFKKLTREPTSDGKDN